MSVLGIQGGQYTGNIHFLSDKISTYHLSSTRPALGSCSPRRASYYFEEKVNEDNPQTIEALKTYFTRRFKEYSGKRGQNVIQNFNVQVASNLAWTKHFVSHGCFEWFALILGKKTYL